MKYHRILLTALCFMGALSLCGETAPSPAAPPVEAETTEEAASEAAEETMNIETADGRIFRNATVERITPSGIDIGYLREDGSYTLTGLPLAQLTPEFQKRFGYDAEKAKAFDAKLRAVVEQPLIDAVESEARRMARITSEIRERLNGGDIKIKPADLRYVIFAHRRSVMVVPVERVLSGTVVAVVEDTSEHPKLTPPLVLIDRLELAEGTGKWSGFIYPTGMHARYRDLERIPVFTDSLDEAQVLLERYLDIYSEFAATGVTTEQPAASQPDQAAQESPYGVSGLNENNLRYAYPYCIGSNYVPIVWWSYHFPDRPWPRPYPPRPYPPRPYPPRPPHPPYPPRPPHPWPGPRPPIPNPHPGPRPQPQPGPRPPIPNPHPGPRPQPPLPPNSGGVVGPSRPQPPLPPNSGGVVGPSRPQPQQPRPNPGGVVGPQRSQPPPAMERNGGFRRAVPRGGR